MLLGVRASRKLSTEADLYAAALRALMRRAHSIFEMRQVLERRAEEKSAVRPVLERLKERKYLDDARYALEFARSRAQGRRQGRFRIERELRQRGVPDRHIEAALEAVFSETDEAALVRARLKRKLAHLGRGELDPRKVASLYRSLLRAGFPGDTVRTELHALSKANLDELIEAPPDEIP
jgi:regulatory protein